VKEERNPKILQAMSLAMEREGKNIVTPSSHSRRVWGSLSTCKG